MDNRINTRMGISGHAADDNQMLKRSPDRIAMLESQPSQEGGWKPTYIVMSSGWTETHTDSIVQDVMQMW